MKFVLRQFTSPSQLYHFVFFFKNLFKRLFWNNYRHKLCKHSTQKCHVSFVQLPSEVTSDITIIKKNYYSFLHVFSSSFTCFLLWAFLHRLPELFISYFLPSHWWTFFNTNIKSVLQDNCPNHGRDRLLQLSGEKNRFYFIFHTKTNCFVS